MTFPVLLVEDGDEKASSIRRELVSSGIQDSDIVRVSNTREARLVLSERSFELVLLDLILPARDDKPTASNGLDLLFMMVEEPGLNSPRTIVGITADEDALRENEADFRRLTTQIIRYDVGSADWRNSIKNLVSHIRRSIEKSVDFDVDVCFVTALRNPELKAILDLPCQWDGEELVAALPPLRKGFIEVGGRVVSLVAAHAPQMGSVSAALTTSALLQAFRPRVLLMTGICGGVGDSPKLGDLVVAEKSWDWQSGKWIDDGSFEAAPDQVPGDRDLINAATSCETELEVLHRAFPGARPGNVPSLHCGPMVSGSAVVADLGKHVLFKKQHRKTIAVDMECYGVYSAVAMSAAPKSKVLCLKSVSDLANRDKSDDYQQYCSYLSASIGLRVIERHFSGL
ncbi:phosphorylase family protein [Burkholderia catarinensis]|uniref:phosphorylase family protein n=1 Tax=Burkholderia catarinensis TaxID=1108140 RepID=UPI0010084384|nr:hypothetical protein [Burkholderia catarinensis]KAG8155199.1 hypothetical protein BFF94_001030 [Burkholderia catarinensis]